MLGLSAATRIYLYQGPADLRCSFDGLAGLVRRGLEADPQSGAWYVFVNRRRTLVKLLCWCGDGFAVWAKRLERGTYRVPPAGGPGPLLEYRQLVLLLEGVTPARLHRRYRAGD
jgi:transposase